MIFTACQLQEKCQQQYDYLYINSIEKFGCPRKLIALVVHQNVHDRMRAAVLDNGDSSESFPVTNEVKVKQGCVIAPKLFSMVLAALLHNRVTMASNCNIGHMEECSTSDDSKQTQW